MIIYLISSTNYDKSIYKIGITKNIKQRIKQFNTSNVDINLVEIFESEWASKIEKALHKEFFFIKEKGEWFNLSNEQVMSFKDRCQKLHDIFELLSKNNTYVIDKKIF